jgi:Molybdopterin-binding domain of aldehyde dehydrogenase/CO dehydrogenase flavoprotein C-terminal domain/2Fe-2S iron-sulfur cluster binding domain
MTTPEPGAIAVALRINGAEHRFALEPRVTLLDALRERLRLTATKKGCDQGQCDACTVHVDGRTVRDIRVALGNVGTKPWRARAVEATLIGGAFDCGRLYNPKLAESQPMGDLVMGLGQALLEAARVDRRRARIVNNIAEYFVPVNADVPDIRVVSVGEPDTLASPIDGKAVGELGITGVAAAVANAVFHATGKRVRDLPISIEKLL